MSLRHHDGGWWPPKALEERTSHLCDGTTPEPGGSAKIERCGVGKANGRKNMSSRQINERKDEWWTVYAVYGRAEHETS